MKTTLRRPCTMLAAAALFLALAALPWACSGSPGTTGDGSAEAAKPGPAARAPLKPLTRKPVPATPAGPTASKAREAAAPVAPPLRSPGAPASPRSEEPDSDPPAESEPGTAPRVKPPAAVGEGTPAASRLAEEEVKEYLKRLSSSPEEADEAFRELWEIPKALIPRLILEVTNTSPSALKEIKILVLEKRGVVRIGETEGEIHYMIPGMCSFEVDEVAAGPAKSGKGLKVVLRNKTGFPVGVVVRAALMNRFRSADHPAGDDRTDCLGWWQLFYDRVGSKL